MAYFLLILLGAIWGASYLFIKIGGETIPPVTLVMMRTTLAAIVLLLAILVRREPLPPRNAPIWKWFFIVALINTVIPYTLITWGEHYISSGLALIVGGVGLVTNLQLGNVLASKRIPESANP